MTDIDRLREQIALVQRVATIVATTQPQWSAALTALLDRLAAAERERGELREAAIQAQGALDGMKEAALVAQHRVIVAERERDELIHDIERHIAIASREAEARIQAERERDAAIRALQTHKGEQ